MQRGKTFTVQLVTPIEGDQAASNTSVLAAGPIDAAEQVLRERLVTFGHPTDLRAKIWELRDDFTPQCTPLYRQAQRRSVSKAKLKDSLDLREETSAFYRILAVIGAVVAFCLLVLTAGEF